MGRLDGKVAFITGAARGQGRSHAIRLAEEGADIVAVDILDDVDTVPYREAREADRDETVNAVEKLDRRILFETADVRDLARLQEVVTLGVSEFGHIDIVCANAGICTAAKSWEMTEKQWQTTIDVNLTGVWKTIRAVAPSMIQAGRGGSIIITSSIGGVLAFPNLVHYNAAKHGVVGVMRSFAVELGQFNIRVNSVHPTNVNTDMLLNPAVRELMTGVPNADEQAVRTLLTPMHILNIPWVDPIDISNAVLWLASDESRYVTGTTQLVDGGATAPYKIPH
jgi:SDR family mycofactocin-dependent oxidoreductase